MTDDRPSLRRTPKFYRGKEPTGRTLEQLLPRVMQGLEKTHQLRPDLVCKGWADVVGPKIAPMTKAVSFINGTLHVKVKGSTLLHLLVTYEKARLVTEMQKRFPDAKLENITFRIG